MTPRTILFTGKGGVGKTSVAAACARRCAAQGLRTLVLSTDPAHSLGDCLGVAAGPQPVAVAGRLWAQEVDAQAEVERHWSAMQDWLGALLAERGVNRITAEELTVPPGADEVFALLELKRQHEHGEWDVIVVDCAPTGETLRLLSFPEVARWWLDRVLPWEQQILAAVGPLARGVLDVPLPSPEALADVHELMRSLLATHEILRDHRQVSIRLVMNPDRIVIAEAMRTFTYLNLYGYLCDAVVVNRIFPDELAGTYFGGWQERQREHLELVEAAFAPLPVLRAPYFEQEIVGAAMLDRLGAALFVAHAPEGVLHAALSQQLSVDAHGAELTLPLPFARRGDVTLKKVGAEVVVRVEGRKRVIMLPSALHAYRPTGARLQDGVLRVLFDAPATGAGAPV